MIPLVCSRIVKWESWIMICEQDEHDNLRNEVYVLVVCAKVFYEIFIFGIL